MPTNRLVYPEANPVQMVPVGTPQYYQYNNDWFVNQIRSYEQPTQYFQKWVSGATVYLQFHSNISPVQVQVLTCDGKAILTLAPTAKTINIFEAGFTTYETSFTVPVVNGTWFILLTAGSGDAAMSFISEPQIIVTNKRDISNLLYFNYWNSYNDGDVLFKTTGIRFGKYIEARIGRYIPKTQSTVWENQPKNLQVVGSVPYKNFNFSLGGSFGVPDYEMIKVNAIFGFTNVLLNGQQFTKEQSEEWQPTEVDNYPLAGHATVIRLTKNLRSLVAENNISPAESLLITYDLNTELFGDLSGDVLNNPVQITDAF